MENTKDIFERLKSSSFSIEKESTLHKGQVVGVYIILAPLSHDGIGELYLASSKLTEKNYVLKLLPPLLPALDPAFQERFAEAAAVLEKQHFHPGIIYTHDIGVDGNFYYIVSEYIETIKGKTYTLRDRLRRKIRMKEKKIRKLAVQVCEAMEYAINNPEAELIHTNLKPSNILFNEDGMAVIADFKELEIIGYDYFINIVKDAIKSTTVEPVVADNKNNGLSETLGNTQESILFKTAKDSISAFLQTKKKKLLNFILGKNKRHSPYEFIKDKNDKTLCLASVMETYDYMSPEQKAGVPPDSRSNVYSFGMILYSLLTGRKISGTWDLPSSFGCDPKWDSLIFRCLQLAPENRLKSFNEIKEAILKTGKKKTLLFPIVSAAAILLVTAFTIVFSFQFTNLPDKINFNIKKRIFSVFDNVLYSDDSLNYIPFKLSVYPENSLTEIYFRDKLIKTVNVVRDYRLELKPGKYIFKICRDGYYTEEKQVNVNFESDSLKTVLLDKTPFTLKKYTELKNITSPRSGYPWEIPELKIKMLPVPPGKFIFGSTIQKDENDLQARETVIKKPFWISEKEISQNQYEEIMWNNPSIFRGDSSMLPVEKVSWKNAVNFCQRLTDKEKRSGRLPEGYIYRLPYEKEWEYCARANVSGRYFFGNDIRHLPAFAWYRGNSLRRTHPGGTRKPNAWGLYDILGNVSEWCISSNTHGYYVLRGGSWGTINSGVRCSSRVKTDSPDFSDNTTGFRIVLAPENISG